jgi:hypothetical protein
MEVEMKEKSQLNTDECPRCGKHDVICTNGVKAGIGVGTDEQLQPLPPTKEFQYRCLKCDYGWWDPL